MESWCQIKLSPALVRDNPPPNCFKAWFIFSDVYSMKHDVEAKMWMWVNHTMAPPLNVCAIRGGCNQWRREGVGGGGGGGG